MKPFYAIVIGAGIYGAYLAEEIYRRGNGNLRVLVLDAGSFLVSEQVQNLSRTGLNVPGPTTIIYGRQEYVYLIAKRFCVNWVGLAAARLANCWPTV